MVGDESRARGFGGVGAREEAREATRGAWRPRPGRWLAGKCRRIALDRTQHQTDPLHQNKQRAAKDPSGKENNSEGDLVLRAGGRGAAQGALGAVLADRRRL